MYPREIITVENLMENANDGNRNIITKISVNI